MARYNLYLRDATFVALVQKAAAEGLTFGKYVNILLDKHVSSLGVDITPNNCEHCQYYSQERTCTNPKSAKYKKHMGIRQSCDKHEKKSF